MIEDYANHNIEISRILLRNWVLKRTWHMLCSSTTASLLLDALMSKHLTDVFCLSNVTGNGLLTNIFSTCND